MYVYIQQKDNSANPFDCSFNSLRVISHFSVRNSLPVRVGRIGACGGVTVLEEVWFHIPLKVLLQLPRSL